jgi:RimJ/RimL family protein N-acetyltransferase
VVSGLTRTRKADGEHPDTGYRRIILKAPRLTLRQFTEDDVDNLFGLNSDPEVMRYLTGGRPTPREELRDEIIPFYLAVYERLDRLGTWAAESTAPEKVPGLVPLPPRLQRAALIEPGAMMGPDSVRQGRLTGDRTFVVKLTGV